MSPLTKASGHSNQLSAVRHNKRDTSSTTGNTFNAYYISDLSNGSGNNMAHQGLVSASSQTSSNGCYLGQTSLGGNPLRGSTISMEQLCPTVLAGANAWHDWRSTQGFEWQTQMLMRANQNAPVTDAGLKEYKRLLGDRPPKDYSVYAPENVYGSPVSFANVDRTSLREKAEIEYKKANFKMTPE